MPLPIWLPSAITAGAGLVGSFGQNAATAAQNAASRRFSIEMYNRQKSDALDFWRQQNEYNSPEAMAKRFELAGFNKNMVAGNVSGGQAGAISTPDVQQAQFRVPDSNPIATAMNTLGQFTDLRIKQAQHDNLKAQNTAILEDTLMTKARKLGQDLSNLKSQAEFEEWNTQAAKNARVVTRDADARYANFRMREKWQDFNLKKQAFQQAGLINPKQRQKLNKQLEYLENSIEWQEIRNEAQHSFIDPGAPIITRLIQGIIQEMLRGQRLPQGWDIKNIID